MYENTATVQGQVGCDPQECRTAATVVRTVVSCARPLQGRTVRSLTAKTPFITAKTPFTKSQVIVGFTVLDTHYLIPERTWGKRS